MIDKLDENTVMLLINAIYFKGQWSKEFDKSETVQMPFHKLGGNSENVPMMRQKTELHIYEGSGFIIAEFPYGQGNFVMDVILPGEQNASGNIIESLNHENFSFWLDNMNQREADVLFPSFKYGYKKPMKDILTDMGMAIAFSEAADFSNISEQVDLLINEVTHQTFIETNEEGTEAAGVTVVDFNVTSVPPPSLYFKMDHPFIYIIRETTTNAILFAGRVTDPSVN
jgi:serpin B